MLTEFSGQSHEDSPIGGIPQGISPDGQQNLVEGGETKYGDYVFSSRLAINKEDQQKYFLPTSVAGKSFAEASKVLSKPFTDRSSSPDKITEKAFLERLKTAQEDLKSKQAAIQESMMANSKQIQDQMGGQIPEGYEMMPGENEGMEAEMMNQQQQNMSETGGMTMAPESPIAAFGGYQSHRLNNLRGDMPVRKFFGGGNMPAYGTADGNTFMANGTQIGNNYQTVGDTSANTTGGSGLAGAAGVAGKASGMAGTALGLGQLAFGKAAQKTDGLAASGRVKGGSMIGGAAAQGASAGMAFGPWGAAIGGVVGAAAGIAGLGKARKAESLNTVRFGVNTNKKFSDSVDAPMNGTESVVAAYGGRLNTIKYEGGGPMAIRKTIEDSYNQNQFDNSRFNPFASNRGVKFDDIYTPKTSPGKYLPYVNQPIKEPINQPIQTGTPIADKWGKEHPGIYGDVNLKNDSFGKQSLDWSKKNYGEVLRTAPIAMNIAQLAKLKKPGGFQYETLSNRYVPKYVDEAQLMRNVDQQYSNQVRGLGEMGLSQGSLASNMLMAGANRTRGVSEAYANSVAQNNAIDDKAQQFNLNVDQYNNQVSNKGIDERRMDDANYRNMKREYLAAIGQNIGDFGKERSDVQTAINLTGYNRVGDYVEKPDGTKATAQEQAAFEANELKDGKVWNPKTKSYVIYGKEKTTTESKKYGGKLHTSPFGGYVNTKIYK